MVIALLKAPKPLSPPIEETQLWPLHIDRINTFARDDSGAYYVVYEVKDANELANLVDFVAPYTSLKPVAVKLLKRTCVTTGGSNCEIEIPAREIPQHIVTRETLRNALLELVDPESILNPRVLQLIAPCVLAHFPLCDVSGKLVSNLGYDADYCKIGDRVFVKFAKISHRYYEFPPELWSRFSGAYRIENERRHDGIEELRALFGIMVPQSELIKYIVQKLGISGEHVGMAVFHWFFSELVQELYGGLIKRYRTYAIKRPGSRNFEYGVFDVICAGYCEAWKVGDLNDHTPAEVILECIESGACPPQVLDSLPDHKKQGVLMIMEYELKNHLKTHTMPRNLREFHIEALKRVLGPVSSYEEAEEVWRQRMREIDDKKKEFEHYMDEMILWRKEAIKIAVTVALEGYPVEVEDFEGWIRVIPTKELNEEEFNAVNAKLQTLGFEYNPQRKYWLLNLLWFIR